MINQLIELFKRKRQEQLMNSCPHKNKGISLWLHPWLEEDKPEGWYAFCVDCGKERLYLASTYSHATDHADNLRAIRAIGGNV